MPQRHDDITTYGPPQYPLAASAGQHTEHRHGRTLFQQYVAVGKFLLNETKLRWMLRRARRRALC
jgi:hypothetical protein